jgi:amino acid transporter
MMMMSNKSKGVWASIVQATFSYMGTELVGVAFGETRNPRKHVPQAVRQTLLRICFFYIAGVIVLGMSVPYNSKGLLEANQGKATGGMAWRLIISQLRKIFEMISYFSLPGN